MHTATTLRPCQNRSSSGLDITKGLADREAFFISRYSKIYSSSQSQPVVQSNIPRVQRPPIFSLQGALVIMNDEQVNKNIKGMDDLDFIGWNNADWRGVFADHHTDDVLVDWKGQPH